MIVVWGEQIANAVEEPDDRPLEIREFHVWPHADDEGLALHVEPGGINAVGLSEKGRVVREE